MTMKEAIRVESQGPSVTVLLAVDEDHEIRFRLPQAEARQLAAALLQASGEPAPEEQEDDGPVSLVVGDYLVRSKVAKQAHRLGYDLKQLVWAANHPEDRWPAPYGQAEVRLGKLFAVLVKPDPDQAHAGILAGLIERTAALEGRPASVGQPKAKSSATSERVKISDLDSFLEQAERAGLVVSGPKPGGHRSVTSPQAPGLSVTMPSTPSDWRGVQNLVSQVRKTFGVDLTEP